MEKKYVGILASANEKDFPNEDIANNYKSLAKGISEYLAKNDFNLVFGGSSKSMMGKCYEEFSRHDKEIIAFTTVDYEADLDNIPAAKGYVCDTTFDVKRGIFDSSDIIVVLPGGIGTYSEVLAFIEEKRSNNRDVPIEIYDEDGYLSNILIETLKVMELKGFTDDSVYGLFNISHNFEEFQEHIDSYQYKKGGNLR